MPRIVRCALIQASNALSTARVRLVSGPAARLMGADSLDATLSVPIPSSQGAAGDPNMLLGGFTSDPLYTGTKP